MNPVETAAKEWAEARLALTQMHHTDHAFKAAFNRLAEAEDRLSKAVVAMK